MIDNKSIEGINNQISDEAEVIESTLGSGVCIDKYTRVEHSILGDKVRLERNNQIVYSNMGRYCYTGANTVIKNVQLGSFDSVAWNVSIGGNTHDLNHITTHSFLVYPKWQMGGDGNWKSASEKCQIGHDVWIGAGASILRGVTIGNGAVIGASSVVTKDVPPYAVVVGNPGRVIRMRCREEWIERLQELNWWEFPEPIIRNNFELFRAELSVDIINKLEDMKQDFI